MSEQATMHRSAGNPAPGTGIAVMILGAGTYQVPMIRRAKELGYRTIVVSIPGSYPGIELADVFVEADTRDIADVIAAARTHNVKAIVSTGTDVAVPAVGAVVDELGLSGTPQTVGLNCMDKTLMKEAFVAHDVPTAQFEIVKTFAQAQHAALSIGLPVMVKASDSSGSRGITKVDTTAELMDAWESAVGVSNNGKVVVEQFLDGIEFGAQAIVQGNEVTAVFFHNDTVTGPPYATPIGHSMPVRLPHADLASAEKVIADAVRSLGISDTVANVDLMLVDGKPMVIEIGARMGATCLAECISLYGGFDAYTHNLEIALGENPTLPREMPHQANAALLLRADTTGTLTSIDIPDDVANHPDVSEIVIDNKPGDSVRAFTVGPDRVGHIVVTSGDADSAEALAEQLTARITINVEAQ